MQQLPYTSVQTLKPVKHLVFKDITEKNSSKKKCTSTKLLNTLKKQCKQFEETSLAVGNEKKANQRPYIRRPPPCVFVPFLQRRNPNDGMYTVDIARRKLKLAKKKVGHIPDFFIGSKKQRPVWGNIYLHGSNPNVALIEKSSTEFDSDDSTASAEEAEFSDSYAVTSSSSSSGSFCSTDGECSSSDEEDNVADEQYYYVHTPDPTHSYQPPQPPVVYQTVRPQYCIPTRPNIIYSMEPHIQKSNTVETLGKSTRRRLKSYLPSNNNNPIILSNQYLVQQQDPNCTNSYQRSYKVTPMTHYSPGPFNITDTNSNGFQTQHNVTTNYSNPEYHQQENILVPPTRHFNFEKKNSLSHNNRGQQQLNTPISNNHENPANVLSNNTQMNDNVKTNNVLLTSSERSTENQNESSFVPRSRTLTTSAPTGVTISNHNDNVSHNSDSNKKKTSQPQEHHDNDDEKLHTLQNDNVGQDISHHYPQQRMVQNQMMFDRHNENENFEASSCHNLTYSVIPPAPSSSVVMLPPALLPCYYPTYSTTPTSSREIHTAVFKPSFMKQPMYDNETKKKTFKSSFINKGKKSSYSIPTLHKGAVVCPQFLTPKHLPQNVLQTFPWSKSRRRQAFNKNDNRKKASEFQHGRIKKWEVFTLEP